MKYILILLLGVFATTSASAQSHDLSNKSNCKLHKKGYYFNAEGKYPCPACTKENKLEQQARDAENKQRADATYAEFKAKKQAEQTARLARIAAAEQKKAQEAKDKAAKAAAVKLANANAGRGAININAISNKNNVAISVPEPEVIYNNAEPFLNYNENVYGLKVDGKIVFQKSFTEKYVGFVKLKETNYFLLNLSDPGDVGERYYILNQKGVAVKVSGYNVFNGYDIKDGLLKLEVHNEKPEFIRKWPKMNLNGPFFTDRAAAVDEVTRPRTGYGIGCSNYYVVSAKVITARMDLKPTDQISAYKIIQLYAKCD
jgi:hypothetical protein